MTGIPSGQCSDWRDSVAVMVAVDSPAGLAREAIDALARHLPSTTVAAGCPLCLGRPWPCDLFKQAAARVMDAGLRLPEFVPLDLHSLLWPPTTPAPSEAHVPLPDSRIPPTPTSIRETTW